MPLDNPWWSLQFQELAGEVCRLYFKFKVAEEPDIDDLDKAIVLFEEIKQAYNLHAISFEEFVNLKLSR
ncbi:MAG TPA: hypothetical protein VL443_29850 [Cyclobacteriaceae bacterium]|jgi:hypothetical protein|nr:hypothetical protein [Cyclobacteriaceae bacterium]